MVNITYVTYNQKSSSGFSVKLHERPTDVTILGYIHRFCMVFNEQKDLISIPSSTDY